MSLRSSRGKKKTLWQLYQEQIIYALLILLLFCFSSLMIALQTPQIGSGELSVWFFDVGQGDAIFLELPTGEQILIDGGAHDEVLAKLGGVMWPTDRTLDYVIASHADADHITGLVEVLDRYRVHSIITNGQHASTQVAQAFFERVENEGAVISEVLDGEVVVIGEVALEIVWPNNEVLTKSDRNEQSVVVLLTYGETSILLTGDAEEGSENVFGMTVGDIDVLKVGHHGSASSTSYEFVQRVDPEYAIISCGLDNRYGHPHPIVLVWRVLMQRSIVRTQWEIFI